MYSLAHCIQFSSSVAGNSIGAFCGETDHLVPKEAAKVGCSRLAYVCNRGIDGFAVNRLESSCDLVKDIAVLPEKAVFKDFQTQFQWEIEQAGHYAR
jgi:hypothetical protein